MGLRNRKIRYRREAFAEVNMTNLIDIVMVLLIVFILVSDFVNTGLNVEIPKVSYAEPMGKERIIVGVDPAGNITLNGNAIQKNQLYSELEALHQESPDEPLFVRGDENAIFGQVMEVMSMGYDIGYPQINLPAKLKRTPSQ